MMVLAAKTVLTKNLFVYMLTVAPSMVLGISIVVPLCMVIVGYIYWEHCPEGEYVPQLLFIGGEESDRDSVSLPL